MRHRPETKNIEAVIREALNKYEAGRERYGQLDLSTDARDFRQEAEQDLAVRMIQDA